MAHSDNSAVMETAAQAAHAMRMHRIKNLTSYEDVSKVASDAIDALFAMFDGMPVREQTFAMVRAAIEAALKESGFDCPFRIENNYVGRGVNNPRVIFLTRAKVRVLKNLATNCADDFDAWKPFLDLCRCEL